MGASFLKKGLFPVSSYRAQGRWDDNGLGRSFQNPFLCSSPRILKCRQGKGEKSGDSGSLSVKSQLCQSGPRVDKYRVQALGWCFSMLESTHPRGSSSCAFRWQRLEAVWCSREVVCRQMRSNPYPQNCHRDHFLCRIF